MSLRVDVDSLFDTARTVPLVGSQGNTLGLPVGEEDETENLCPSLSFQERVIGFAVCLGLGFLLSIFAWVSIFALDFNTFAVINTVSNVTSIGSTMFLCGPMAQLKRMFDSKRLIATIIYFTSMALTFIAALVLRIPWLTIITVLVQYAAMLWYCLSYIPFAHTAVLKVLGLG
ncbi:putative Got1/Sft2-like family [Trypanosoma cruzi]|nr:putative Got1/Sft2-like family [Trypanosoma cruzi]